MSAPFHPQIVAWSLEVTATADAYSFSRYGVPVAIAKAEGRS